MQGLINCMFDQMLGEGTQDYTDQEFSDAAEARGISINVQGGPYLPEYAQRRF